MQQAALFRRERQFAVSVVIVVRLRLSARSARDIWGFFFVDWLSPLMWIFSRRLRRFSQIKDRLGKWN